MKAVYFTKHGGIEVLTYGDLPEPKPMRGEVVIRVHASSMNYNDIWARQGLDRLEVPLPHISGTDAAGVVVQVGEDVNHVKVGDEIMAHVVQSCRVCAPCLAGEELFCKGMKVWGFQTGPYVGGYAEYATLQATQCIPKPKELSWTDAAAIPGALVSVWRMLVTRARVQPGESVLVFGASGGTGSYAVQLLRAMGCTSIAVVSSERKAQLCLDLGATHIIRSDKQDVVKEAIRITGRRGVDVVFDHGGITTWSQGISALRWGGRMVICGATEGFDAQVDLRVLWNKQLSLLGSHVGTHSELLACMRMVNSRQIRPCVTEVIGLQDLADAQVRMQNRQTMGKIAVTLI